MGEADGSHHSIIIRCLDALTPVHRRRGCSRRMDEEAGKLPNMKRAWGVAAESSLPLGPPSGTSLWDPWDLVCHIHAGAEDAVAPSPEVIVLGSHVHTSKECLGLCRDFH